MDDARQQSAADTTSAYESLTPRGHKGFIDELAAGAYQHVAYYLHIYRGSKYVAGEQPWKSDPDLYNTLCANASILISNHKYRKALQERCAEKAMSLEEAIARLGDQGRNIQMAYLLPDGSIDLPRLIRDGWAHLVKGTKYDKDGRLIVEFYDVQYALNGLLKALGAYNHKQHLEHSGSVHYSVDGADITIRHKAKDDDDEQRPD